MKTGRKTRVFRGLTTVTSSVLALSIAAGPVINIFRTDIDKFLGTHSTAVVTDESAEDDLYTYKSDYTSTTDLLHAISDLGERMEEEGAVLLKNNGALPLTKDETQKVSLLGFSSYYPVQGGDMGSSLVENTGTDADTVDFVKALAARGWKINPTLQSLYEALLPTFSTEVETWGGTATYSHITAPSIGGTFASKEPSQKAMDGQDSSWKDSLKDNNVMIVTLARSGSENGSYLPGEEGVDSSQNLNQTDPLGLSDDERDLIAAAVDAKKANGGKVIVLLNNSSAMEVQEIEDNEGVDAIMQIGLPGGYGFYGVADLLSGDANPSGHLTDTYATDASDSPAAQNYGDFEYTNADPSISMNSEVVEAEGIYTGYKYYETRYEDEVLGQGNADSATGSTDGQAWDYSKEVTYPFGYGLSYTTFSQTLDSVDVDLTGNVTAKITVTNTGSVAGKDVVQLYVSTPYTDYDIEHGVEKAGVQLLDYAKTDVLDPGASQTVTIEADPQYMASWDSTAANALGTTGDYILDAGDYYFAIGNGSHEAMNNVLAAMGKTSSDGMTADGDTAKTAVWNLASMDTTTFATTKNGTAVENHMQDMDLNYWMPDTVTYLTRNDWDGTFPKTYEGLTATDEMKDVLDNDIYEITENNEGGQVTWGADNGLTLADLKGNSNFDDESWSLLTDQLTLPEAMIRVAFGGTSTKAIASVNSPEVIQNDGPNGIYSYTLGQYANTDTSSSDPCAVSADDPNLNYKFGTMVNETVIAQTFNKDLAAEYGQVLGNYSLWSNLTILWGSGVDLHRTPYNARNHEYFSEDPMLSSYQSVALIESALKYGLIVAPKHVAFNDTEINRTGVSVFMTEQKAREGELRSAQASVEDAGALGIMTAFNRAGVTAMNAYTGIMQNVLRDEWGFRGLISEDFIMDPNYAVLKEGVMCGLTMTTFTGDDSLDAVAQTFSYWTEDNVSKDSRLQAALKQDLKYQLYAIANSNALDGLSSNSELVSVRTWYDNLVTALIVVFAALTVLNLALYFKSAKKENA